jgi:hypothetical protein
MKYPTTLLRWVKITKTKKRLRNSVFRILLAENHLRR